MQVRFKLSLPHLEFVSDRTFKSLITIAARAVRQIQIGEIHHVIARSNLTPRQKQSLTDRLERKLDSAPTFYVEAVSRGSWEFDFRIAAAIYWLLQTTLGEAVKEAWRKTDFHRRLVAFLSNQFPRGHTDERVQTELGLPSAGPQGERWQRLEHAFAGRLGVGTMFGRFEVSDLSIEETETGDMLVLVTLDTTRELAEGRDAPRRFDDADVIARSLVEIEKASGDEDPDDNEHPDSSDTI